MFACRNERTSEERETALPRRADASSGTTAPAGSSGGSTAARDAAAPSASVADAGTPSPRIADLLDAEKGKRAVAGYRAFLSSLCEAVRTGDADSRAARLKRAGLNDGISCSNADTSPKALASGSFAEPGSDDVLLQVSSGLDAAAGDATLAMLRQEGGGYRLLHHMLASRRFEARARLTVPGGTDILFLCQHSGNMGVYTATCGFLGRGSFRGSGRAEIPAVRGRGAGDELDLVSSIACGPGASVSLGAISERDGRLLVELIAKDYRREPAGPDDVSVCSKQIDKSTERFIIEFALDATGPRRVTPIPRRVRDILKRY